MANDKMRNLRKRMQEERNAFRGEVKKITFDMPELTGPQANPVWLMNRADSLMADAGISPDTRSIFSSEAMSGDQATEDYFDHMIETIAEWFTVRVAVVKYVPLEDAKTYVRQWREQRNSESVDRTAEYEALAAERAAQPIAVTPAGDQVFKKDGKLVKADGTDLKPEDLGE